MVFATNVPYEATKKRRNILIVRDKFKQGEFIKNSIKEIFFFVAIC